MAVRATFVQELAQPNHIGFLFTHSLSPVGSHWPQLVRFQPPVQQGFPRAYGARDTTIWYPVQGPLKASARLAEAKSFRTERQE